MSTRTVTSDEISALRHDVKLITAQRDELLEALRELLEAGAGIARLPSQEVERRVENARRVLANATAASDLGATPAEMKVETDLAQQLADDTLGERSAP